jgi:hypothetical protein
VLLAGHSSPAIEREQVRLNDVRAPSPGENGACAHWARETSFALAAVIDLWAENRWPEASARSIVAAWHADARSARTLVENSEKKLTGELG